MFCLGSCLDAFAQDMSIVDHLDKVETSLRSLESRAETAMQLIAQHEEPHVQIAAFSSAMAVQAQELRAIKNFDESRKVIDDQEKRLSDSKRISESARKSAAASLEKSRKRLEVLQNRAETLQKKLEILEKSADQWGADFAHLRSIDEKEAVDYLRKSIDSELRNSFTKQKQKESPKR